jgi:large subunit ribosomal protein L6
MIMPVFAEARKEIDVPEGVKVEFNTTYSELVVTGPMGTLKRQFKNPKIKIEYKNNKIAVLCSLPRKKDNALVGTWGGHIKNMVQGASEGFEYKMKIVYSHFPIKTHVKDDELIIENFLGEKQPRKAKMVGDTKVKVSGDQIILNGADIEATGQSVANIERATRIKRYDPRVFQDGIYLVEHPKK